MSQSVPQRSWLWRLCQVIARLTTTEMFDLKVWGAEHIPSSGGVLLLSNHQSYLDPVLLGVRLKRPISYMAKNELFGRNKFFTWLIESLHAFPIKQHSADVGAIKQAIAKLLEGNVLNVYPEGHRTLDGELRPILPGVSLIVRKVGATVPIVPVVIDGSFQAWPKGSKLFHRHPIRILYGPPMRVEGLKAAEIVKLIEKTMRELFTELRRREKLIADGTWRLAADRSRLPDRYQ
jgi:1-acyl-sn-glycerol-3-phosphate acyltransferase